MNVPELLARLQGVRQSGSGWTARCPAHDDRNPSLSVNAGNDGRVLLHCHSGCSADSIVAALGVTLRDLMPESNGQAPTNPQRESKPDRVFATAAEAVADLERRHGKRSACWTYRDASSEPVGVTVRWDRPNGEKVVRPVSRHLDGWRIAAMPEPRPLYRLPELAGASRAFIAEGEKCADALAALGLTATTSPGGSKAAAKADWTPLAGHECIILPDADGAGAKYAEAVASILVRLNPPASARIVNLPDLSANSGEDVADFIAERRADGKDDAAIRREIEDLAASAEAWTPASAHKSDDGDDEKKPKSQASVLIQLATDAELWHCGEDAYATIGVGDHREHWPLRGKRLRGWLAYQYHERFGRGCGSQAIQDAILTIEGQARFDGEEHPVYMRVAEHADNLYLDLCDDDWRAVEITRDGWQIVTNPPVRFRRAKAMLPLPEPERGGSLDELRQFVNVGSDEDFVLIVSWLIAAFRPGRPAPVLGVNGEQGSAKSTASRLLRSLIDPNTSPLRSEPREPRDLAIAANNSAVVALDNLSHISPWLSDCLCRLSTGGGFATRTLYENDEETIFSALRPVLLNGIDEVATRSDLLDRMIRVTLPTIPDERRRDEDDLYRAFDQAQPRILGAILAAASAGLRDIGTVQLARAPRMADFSKWIVACEPALPWEPGAFMAAYCGNRDAAHELAIEASPIGAAVRDFAEAVGEWHGTATELLSILNERVGEQNRKVKGWPSKPHVLSGALRRIAPNLRALGVTIDFGKREGRNRTRLLAIRTGTQTSVQSVHSVRTGDSASASGDECGRSADACGRSPETERPPKTAFSAGKTHADAADAVSPTHSKEEAEAWKV